MPGTVLLTFDDHGVSGWHRHAGILAAHDARVTFYLSHADLLTAQERAELEELAAAGHEIGAHGHRHLRATETVAQSSMREWLATEVEPCIATLTSYGHRVTSFAYPYGTRDENTDAALLELFGSIRGTSPRTADPDEARRVINDPPPPRVLGSRGVDVGRLGVPNPDDRPVLEALFAETAQRDGVLCLYAHNLVEETDDLAGTSNYLTPARLEEILSTGERYGLRFTTVSSQY